MGNARSGDNSYMLIGGLNDIHPTIPSLLIVEIMV